MRQRSFLNASLAVLAPAILALAVSACAQDFAGITRAEVTFEDGALAAVSFIAATVSAVTMLTVNSGICFTLASESLSPPPTEPGEKATCIGSLPIRLKNE